MTGEAPQDDYQPGCSNKLCSCWIPGEYRAEAAEAIRAVRRELDDIYNTQGRGCAQP
jgi:hypothetical protein